MLYLLLCVLASTAIIFLFKYIGKYNFSVIYPIIINYVVASTIGLIFTPINFNAFIQNSSSILPLSGILGLMFIVMFFVIGVSAQRTGVIVTGIATRISVIIPMLFALVFYSESYTIFKISGIILAVPALILSTLKKSDNKINWRYFYLPVILFFGSGFNDTLVEFAQHTVLDKQTQSSFTILVFLSAGILGLIYTFVRKLDLKKFIKKEILISGILLGMLNYISLYFIIAALKTKFVDDSVLFGFNHIGVLLFSVILGMIFFKEKPSKLNYLGILLSLTVIILLSLHK